MYYLKINNLLLKLLITFGLIIVIAGVFFWSNLSQPELLSEQIELVTIEGEAVNLSQLTELPVVINYWASWCPPCVRELPLLQSYGDREDMQLILVNQGETVDQITEFLRKSKLSFEHILLDPVFATSEAMQIVGLPTTLFYNDQGELVHKVQGEVFEQDMELFLDKVSSLK